MDMMTVKGMIDVDAFYDTTNEFKGTTFPEITESLLHLCTALNFTQRDKETETLSMFI